MLLHSVQEGETDRVSSSQNRIHCYSTVSIFFVVAKVYFEPEESVSSESRNCSLRERERELKSETASSETGNLCHWRREGMREAEDEVGCRAILDSSLRMTEPSLSLAVQMISLTRHSSLDKQSMRMETTKS